MSMPMASLMRKRSAGACGGSADAGGGDKPLGRRSPVVFAQTDGTRQIGPDPAGFGGLVRLGVLGWGCLHGQEGSMGIRSGFLAY